MTDKEQLIEAWTRNLEDNAEHQLHAIGLLTEEIDDNAASMPVVSAMLQKVTPQSRENRRRMVWGLVIVAVLLSLTLMILPLQLRNAFKLVSFDNIGEPQKQAKIRTTTPQDELLLYGNPRRNGKAEQMRALWESDPKNPAYFADYSLHYLAENGAVPPDFLKIAAEIDPENAWFTCLAAAVKAKEVCKKGKEHPRSPVSQVAASSSSDIERILLRKKIVYEYTIVDSAKAQEALDLWRQSLKQSKYDSYEIAMHQKRYPLLRHRNSFVDDIQPMMYTLCGPVTLRSRDLATLLAASLQQANLQSEEGKQLIRDINAYTERLILVEPISILDILILRSMLRIIFQQIHVIDSSVVDQELAATWEKRVSAMDEYERELQENSSRIGNNEILVRHGSLLTSLALPAVYKQIATPLQPTTEELAPLRYVDYILFFRLTALALCVLLFATIPCHLYMRRHKLLLKMSDEAWQAMPWRSVALLTLFAVAVPLLFYVLLTIFTPLTGKEFGLLYSTTLPYFPLISLALLLILLPRLLVHRFTAPWEQLMPSRSRWLIRLGWLTCALLLIPLHTMLYAMGPQLSEQKILPYGILCWAPAVLWLVWNGWIGVFTRDPYLRAMHGLRRRVLGACSACTVLILIFAAWALQPFERYWLQQDKIMAISYNQRTSGYESVITRVAHQELREIMEK